ncbi:hypothetical protein Trydic_g4464 [Trypoxylus dichotomus]
MDLFVINRHDEDTTTINEKQNLEKLLKRVEKNKELRAIKKNKKKTLIANVKQERQKKRNLKRQLEIEEAKQSDTLNLHLDKQLCGPSDSEEDKEGPNVKKKVKVDPSVIEGYTILGVENFNKKSNVKRVLPNWLANPAVISSNLQNLETKFRQKLFHGCYSPINILILFFLEIFVYLHQQAVGEENSCIGHTTNTRPSIPGKNSFENEQKQLLSKNDAFGYISKVDILVCTAGRLVDHLKSTEGFDLTSLEYLIIDEADRVLDSVQHDWLYHLERHISNEDSSLHSTKILNLHVLKKQKPPQKLLFSATLSQDPEKLQKLSLFQPKLFTSVIDSNKSSDGIVRTDSFIGKYTTPKELSEKYIVCSIDLKPLVLYEFIRLEKLTKTMVFTHSIESTHRLTILLKSLFNENMKIEEVSSILDAKNRNKLIEDFSAGKIDVIVCTDTLARGIDLPGVQAGRTARAGEYGLAVTLLHKSQVNKFQSLLEHADKKNMDEIKIPEEDLEPLSEQYKHALDDLKNTIYKEEHESLAKLKSVKRHSLTKKIMSTD